jgi:hypothetical protein
MEPPMTDTPTFDPETLLDAMVPLLATMAALVDGMPLDEREEPAAVYRP